jgi:integrase
MLKAWGRAYGHRDATMILIAYRHGLRASELCGLRWDQIDLNSGRLHVRRAKGGIDNVHPLGGNEIRALRQLRRENMESRYVFVTERGGPATTAVFLKTIARTGEAAKLPFPVHPHMLRHSTGYKLANDGHDIHLALQLANATRGTQEDVIVKVVRRGLRQWASLVPQTSWCRPGACSLNSLGT